MSIPILFYEESISGHESFLKVFVIANTASLPYIVKRNTEKGGNGFDSLCNGRISVGYARKSKY